MALNKPVPEGGTANNLVVLSDDAHELTDRGLYEGSATWNPAEIADDGQESKDITVTGAALGDYAIVGAGVDIVDLGLSVAVTAADTVTVTLTNQTGGAVNLNSSTWRAMVIKA